VSLKSSTPLLNQKGMSQEVTWEEWIRRSLLLVVLFWLTAGILMPLYQLAARSFQNLDGNWIGFANYLEYFSSPSLSASLLNSLQVAIASTLVSVSLGFVCAYAVTRTAIPGKALFRLLFILPISIPSVTHGIGLIYLFGNQGLVTKGFFGWFQANLGFDPSFDLQLYGFNGILFVETLYCLPLAILMLIAALNIADARLYEAAESLKTPVWRTFLTVTLPSVKYGLFSTILVCFMLTFTDFGAPIVVGGKFNVLATDIYKQVIGQQNLSMGATISILLVLPTLFIFILNRIVEKQQIALLGSRVVPLQPKRNLPLDLAMFAFCTAIASIILSVIGTSVFASFVNVWYNLNDFSKLRFTLEHYNVNIAGSNGIEPFWNSLQLALYSAGFGTIAIFSTAYLVEKSEGWQKLRSLISFLSTLPNALPGMVIGLSYIFFFNLPSLQIPFTSISFPNPFGGIYQSIALLVIANIIHYHTVSFVTVSTALKQLDPEFEAVAASMKVPFYITLWRVTLPLSLSAISQTAVYLFVNSLQTVSALVFLYSAPGLLLASVTIVNLEDAGETPAAAAMSTLIVLTSLAVQAIYWTITRGLIQRSRAWTN
jgi:iron(III) transport system permease protein